MQTDIDILLNIYRYFWYFTDIDIIMKKKFQDPQKSKLSTEISENFDEIFFHGYKASSIKDESHI